jgi:lipoyl-dependent peroxiredoxin
MSVLSFRVVRSAQASWRGTVAEGAGRIARVTLAQDGDAFNITRIELRTVGDVPGADAAAFSDLAQRAKDCTVARALTGTEITLEARVAGD